MGAAGRRSLERLYRLVNQGELVIQRLLRIPDQGQRQAQHGIGAGRGPALHQAVAQCARSSHVAPSMKCQGLHPGAKGGGDGLHRRSAGLPQLHALEKFGRSLQLLPERRG